MIDDNHKITNTGCQQDLRVELSTDNSTESLRNKERYSNPQVYESELKGMETDLDHNIHKHVDPETKERSKDNLGIYFPSANSPIVIVIGESNNMTAKITDTVPDQIDRPTNSESPSTHYECELCKRKFTAKNNLKKHIENQRCQTKCNKCKNKYTTRRNLLRQQRISECQVTNRKDYKCEKCKKKFKTKESQERHIKYDLCNIIMHYECRNCQNKYMYRKNLLKHQPLSHFEKTLREHECRKEN